MFAKTVLIFFVWSVIGWLWETCYCSLKDRHFDYRGFLLGPYCPIYGFGVSFVLVLTQRFADSYILLFLVSAVVCSILEYVTSWVLEALFHTSWWDYDDVPLNINGRIALPISIFWGAACVVVVRWIEPMIDDLVQWTISHTGDVLAYLIMVIMLADTVYTVINMKQFQQKAAMLGKQWDTFKQDVDTDLSDQAMVIRADQTELRQKRQAFRQKFADEMHQRQLKSFDFNQRRFLRSYKKLKMRREANFVDLKNMIRKGQKF